jgi:two-component system, OmpR family, phosphate regulon sensor histidine kinase PhoR
VDREYDELWSMHRAVVADLERYRALFDAAPSALLVTDPSLRVLEANLAATELLDVEKRFLFGKPLVSFVDAEHRRQVRTWPSRLLRGDASRSAHVRMRRRSGVAFEARLTVTVGRGELYWTIVDMTEEAQAELLLWELKSELEERVSAQSAELEALVEQLPVGVMVLDATGEISWLNSRAMSLVGREGLPGSPLADRASPALRGTAVRADRLAVKTPHGLERTIELIAVPVPRHGGAALLFSDVTERERLERADAEFVENAAHQLRTPIAAIASSVAALEAGASGDETERERFLGHIARESDRLRALVEALLHLASLQRHAGRPLVELIPLKPLLDDLAASTPVRDGVRIVVHCSKRIGAVADRELLAQAVGNVVANAADHTDQGQIRLRAKFDGKSVTVEVADSGPGISPAARDRVFERFFRSSTNGRRGSGLGLPIALAAAEATGARLELLPQCDREGATFRFTIPGAQLL